MDFWTLPKVMAPYLHKTRWRDNETRQPSASHPLDRSHTGPTHRCSRKRSDVKSRYSETLWPVMSVRMSPVTTLIWGGCPPTLLGQEKPVPCVEQVQRTGSRTRRGREGADVHVSVGTAQHSEMGSSRP